MKKALKVSLLSALAALLILASFPSFAAEPYTYTVRIFSGAQGTFSDGSTVIVYDGLKKGDRIDFNRNGVKVKNPDKYYVMEMRESGKDNFDSKHPQLSSVAVTGDKDYVVAYGIKGDTVACKINYKDKNGKTLRESDTFYGNVGDEPIFASQYVDGYQPDAYNKTIKLGASGNEVTFVYKKAASTSQSSSSGGSGSGNTNTGNTNTGNTNTGNTNTGRTAATVRPSTTAQNTTTTQNPTTTQDQGTNEDNEPAQEPSELTDIDGNEIPYASGPEKDTEEAEAAEEEHSSKVPLIVTAICAAALLAGVIAFFAIRKKRSEE